MYATKNIRAWTWLLSSRIGIVPTVAVYLISRPSMCTTCDVDEAFSSLGPKYSSRAVGADVVALGGGCAGGGPPPRPPLPAVRVRVGRGGARAGRGGAIDSL